MAPLLLAVLGWAAALGARALQDGQALTPPMGFNTWLAYGADIDEGKARATADLLVDLGLRDAGYAYLVLDDGWSEAARDADGRLAANRQRFPSGIKALADYVHFKGLKLGLYSDSGHFTCQGFPGSRDYEKEDAQSYAEWDVDLLKFDNCFTHDDLLGRFVAMRDALNASGRPIVFMLCEWGIGDPWLWGPQVAHSWRTTFDIHAPWASVLGNLDESLGLARYAGPGRWNDLDMLEVGGSGQQPNDRVLSEKEERAHFAVWAVLKSPLFIASDLRRMPPASLKLLKKKEIIAVNQDPLGVPGDLIWQQGPKQVFAAPLASGGRAVVLLNRHSLLSQYQTSNFTVRWSQLGYAPELRAAVRDLYAERDLGVFQGSFSAEVRLHDALAVCVTPLQPTDAHREWRPWQGQPLFERHEEDEQWIPPLRRVPAAA